MKLLKTCGFMLLSACNGQTMEDFDTSFTDPLPERYPTIFFIGDSICDPRTNAAYTAVERAGFKYNCRSGRRLERFGPEHFHEVGEYAIRVLALGVNDARKAVPLDTYRARVKEFRDYDDATFWCVLPVENSAQIDAEPYRQIMREECGPNVIDPYKYGITYTDGVHWTAQAQAIMGAIYEARIAGG